MLFHRIILIRLPKFGVRRNGMRITRRRMDRRLLLMNPLVVPRLAAVIMKARIRLLRSKRVLKPFGKVKCRLLLFLRTLLVLIVSRLVRWALLRLRRWNPIKLISRMRRKLLLISWLLARTNWTRHIRLRLASPALLRNKLRSVIVGSNWRRRVLLLPKNSSRRLNGRSGKVLFTRRLMLNITKRK